MGRWRGKRILYKIENMPECHDGLTVPEVKRIIDAAANRWNQIPRANVLLVNADTLSGEEEPTIDIRISFLPCEHKDPNLKLDSDFVPCEGQYAHAIHFGDMHLNSFMTWTGNANLREKDIRMNEFVMPNLYTIVLHEFGHTLGLSHSQDPRQVMFALFGGDRKHKELELGAEDIERIQELYPPEQSCKDRSVFCKPSVCGDVAKRRACPHTCGDCTCDASTPDDYLKCSSDICSGESDLRELCKKTCNLCAKCSGLPFIRKITSTTTFPVRGGDVIRVGCETGHVLEGDVEVTCVEGNEFSYRT